MYTCARTHLYMSASIWTLPTMTCWNPIPRNIFFQCVYLPIYLSVYIDPSIYLLIYSLPQKDLGPYHQSAYCTGLDHCQYYDPLCSYWLQSTFWTVRLHKDRRNLLCRNPILAPSKVFICDPCPLRLRGILTVAHIPI